MYDKARERSRPVMVITEECVDHAYGLHPNERINYFVKILRHILQFSFRMASRCGKDFAMMFVECGYYIPKYHWPLNA